MKRAINRLYGSNASVGGPVERAEEPASEQKTKTSLGILANGCRRHYVANIASQKFAMNGSYAVYVFLGDFEDDTSAWPLSKNLAGTHAVAASMVSKHATNARPVALATVKVTGSVPLTDLLLSKVQAGELASMNTKTVEKYMSKNLKWRIATVSHGVLGLYAYTLITHSSTQWRSPVKTSWICQLP